MNQLTAEEEMMHRVKVCFIFVHLTLNHVHLI